MRVRDAFLVPFALALVLAGCDVPANLLSSEERNSLYSIEMSQSGRGLQTGATMAAGSEVGLSIATLSGMKKPDSLALDLVDSNGTKIASTVFASPSNSRALDSSASLVHVESLVGSLPGFRLPNQLAPGYYALKSTIFVGNSPPQQNEFDFFVPSTSYEFGGVTFSPTVPRAGSGVLLTAILVATGSQSAVASVGAIAPASSATQTPISDQIVVTSLPEAENNGAASSSTETNPSSAASTATSSSGTTQASIPVASATASLSGAQSPAVTDAWSRLWFRWTQGSQVIAEGSASAGFDKIVWKAPDRDGAYSVRVDFYPGPPPNGSYSIPSPWHQSISFIAKPPPPARFKDPFATPSRFHSLFSFDGAIVDSATGASEKPPVLIGNPMLVATAEGYGERFSSNDGFTVKGLGFDPTAHAGKFSILLRLSMESLSGNLLTLEAEGGDSLTLGLERGALWFEFQQGGLPHRVTPGLFLSRGLHDLMLSFSPEKDGLSIQWSLDAGLRKQTLIPNGGLRYERMVVGGASSATAVWDALGLCYDDIGGPPSLFAASLFRSEGEKLLAANGFESGIGDVLVTNGNVKFRSFSVTLAAGTNLGIRDELPTDAGLTMSFGLRSGAFNLVLTRLDGSLFMTIGSDGSIRDGSGLSLASILEDPHRFSISLTKTSNGIGLSGIDGQANIVELQLPTRLKASLVSSASTTLESYWIASNADT